MHELQSICPLCGKSKKCSSSKSCKSCSMKLRWKNESYRKKLVSARKGMVFTVEHIKNMCLANAGKNNPNYRCGKISIPCSYCGKTTYHYPNRIKKWKNRFCNQKCRGKWQSLRFRGKKHPNYGKKIPNVRGSYYKNIWMRSSYEIAYAKWLDKRQIMWLYEPKVFKMDCTTYTPDFYLVKKDVYIEIKGWWKKDALNKFLAFKLLYPEINIEVLMQPELKRMKCLS